MPGSPVYTQPLGGPDNGNSVWTPADGPNPYDNFDPPNEPMPYPVEGGAGGILGDIGKWWDGGKGILNLMPGSDGKSIAAGLMIPAWMAAYQSWQNAGKYSDTAKEAMKYGDPFGQANREYYQGKLKQSWEHPEEFLMDPGHQAKRKSGIDAVSRADASKGYLGSGNMEADLAAYVNNLDNQFLSDERKNLMGLTGAQFDPAQAGKFLMQGNEQEIQAKNAALQALMYPFAMNMTENHITNQNTNPGGSNGGGGPGIGPGNPINWSKYGSTPEQIQKELAAITQGLGGLGANAGQLWNAILGGQYQDISPSTRMFIEDMANDPATNTGSLGAFFPETGEVPGGGGGYVDYPSPGYNPFGPSDWETGNGGIFDPDSPAFWDFDSGNPGFFDP